MTSENETRQIERFERKFDKFAEEIRQELKNTNNHLLTLNGSVSRHSQTLYGPYGRGGLEEKFDRLVQAIKPSGMTTTKTVWAAVGALAGVAAVFVALVIGLSP